jgi:hypothetical protein
MTRILHAEMSKTANAEHRDELPAFADELRSALNIVRPAQSRGGGAAATDLRSSGTDISPLPLAIITSA